MVTNIRQKPRTRIRRGPSRRFDMQQDIQADAPPSSAPADDPEITGELLVEEVSIDGMCGVY